MSEVLYKVLDQFGYACHGGLGKWSLPTRRADGTWIPGDWMPYIDHIALCTRGYHLCRERNLIRWLGSTIYVAEYKGPRIDGDDKIVVATARLLRPVETWTERTARLFAADCAEHVLPVFEDRHPWDGRPRRAIEVIRAYARGGATAPTSWAAVMAAVEDAHAAGESAFGNLWAAQAATDAATAAGETARTAFWIAAQATAQSATWAAARRTGIGDAQSAEWQEAWSAEYRWQTARLMQYLRGEIT